MRKKSSSHGSRFRQGARGLGGGGGYDYASAGYEPIFDDFLDDHENQDENSSSMGRIKTLKFNKAVENIVQ